jgi:hypothetical protein
MLTELESESAYKVSYGNEDSTKNQSRGHLYYTLAKNLSTFVHALILCERLSLKVTG